MKIAGRDKIKGRKVDAEMSQRATPGHFGKDAATVVLVRAKRPAPAAVIAPVGNAVPAIAGHNT